MGNRLKKAMQALGLVLLITVACLAFMPWKMTDVIDGLDKVERCVVLRYDLDYSTAYPQDVQLESVKTALSAATGHFDRNRDSLVYKGEAPLYRIYFWTEEGRISDVWLCDTAFFHNGAQYVLDEAAAAAVNAALASCFS